MRVHIVLVFNGTDLRYTDIYRYTDEPPHSSLEQIKNCLPQVSVVKCFQIACYGSADLKYLNQKKQSTVVCISKHPLFFS